MVPVNLLPWRELRRKRAQRHFICLLILAAIIALMLTMLLHFIMEGRIKAQQFRNDYLQQHIAILTKQASAVATLNSQVKTVNSQIALISGLEKNRDYTVYLLETIAQIMPSGAYLTSLQYTSTTVTLQGAVTSSAEITVLLNNLANVKTLRDPKLTNLSTFGNQGLIVQQFTITAAVQL